MKILIVDDSADDRKLFEYLLAKAGFYDLVCLDSAEATYRALGLDDRHAPPTDIGVILMDMQMPGDDGIAACRRIKANPRMHDIALILVTPDSESSDLAAAFAAGAMDYLSKPVARQELIARMRSAIQRVSTLRQLRKERNTTTAILEAAATLLIVLDCDGRIVRFNRSCERLTGYSEAEMLGQHVWDRLLRSEDIAPVKDVFTRLHGSLIPSEHENHWLARDGSEHLIAWSNSVVCGSDGRARLIIGTGVDITEQRCIEQTMRENERYLRQITSALGEGLLVTDREGRVTFMNPEAERLLGWNEAQMLGRDLHGTIHYREKDGSPSPARDCPLFRVSRHGGEYRTEDDIFFRHDGGAIPVAYVTRALLEQNEPSGSVTAFRDITTQQEMETELRLAAELVEISPNGIMVTDLHGTILKVNPAFCRITGYSEAEAIGHTPNLLHSGRHDATFYAKLWQSLQEHGYWHGEIWNRRKDGVIYPEWLSITAILDRQGQIERYMAIFLDITEHKEIELRLQHIANHDHLTGLPNRLLLAERLEHAIAYARRDRQQIAVLFLDLDGFKPINDRLGHDVGDLVLMEVANRLHGCVRATDTVSRMGGDEFVIILTQIPLASENDIPSLVAEKILAEIARPFHLERQELGLGVSIGIALYPEHEQTADKLISAADTAMYEAKKRGKMRYCFHLGEFEML